MDRYWWYDRWDWVRLLANHSFRNSSPKYEWRISLCKLRSMPLWLQMARCNCAWKNNVNLCVKKLPLHKRHGDVTNDFLEEGAKIYISFHKSLQFSEAPTALTNSAWRVTSNIRFWRRRKRLWTAEGQRNLHKCGWPAPRTVPCISQLAKRQLLIYPNPFKEKKPPFTWKKRQHEPFLCSFQNLVPRKLLHKPVNLDSTESSTKHT